MLLQDESSGMVKPLRMQHLENDVKNYEERTLIMK